METSEKITKAYNDCLQYGDSDEMADYLEGSQTRVSCIYVVLNEDLSSTDSFLAGAEAEYNRPRLQKAFCTGHDGNGVWVFYGDEDTVIVGALEEVARQMKKAIDDALGPA